MDDDILELDSPEQEPVDDLDDDDLVMDLHLPPTAKGPASPAHDRTKQTRRKLQKPKEKPRTEQLDYPKSLPYEVETLDEMDQKLELILRRLIDCVRAKD